jgi:hypothetical protein
MDTGFKFQVRWDGRVVNELSRLAVDRGAHLKRLPTKAAPSCRASGRWLVVEQAMLLRQGSLHKKIMPD